MGPKKQEPESSASPKGKETASEPADEADEAGSGNAPPASEGAAASSGASVEASEPEMTKSAKKRQRKAEAKAAMRGMKTLIGDVKQGLAEKKQREAAHEGDVTPTEPEQETAPETVTPAIPKDGSPTPDEEERAASPPRPSPDEKRLGESRSRNPYATATESAAASALLSEAHAAYASRRVADAARLYEGAAAENGAGYAPLMALRAHEGDAAGALAALRSAAAVPGAATFAAQETRDMASALGRLFVTSAAARAGASRESRAAHISFPTPDGWFEPGRREENVAPLAARRLIADARPAMACGLTLRGLDPDRFGDETNKTNKTSASASSAMAAAEALRVARPDTKGWRLAARLLAAAGRALSGADASAAKACLMASAGVVAGGIGTAVPDPLEAVAESEWALASDETPGLDETLTEEARGVVVAAAADVCADRIIAAVAARVPSAQSLERHRFDADPDADGGFGGFGGFGKNRDGSSRPPAALVSALRALVGCVSATGASGAEAAHGALYRAADAVWALECLETYERKKAAHESQRATEVSESELGTAAVALASAAAPSNAFGWDPHVVLAFCAKSCASMASPAPELADAVASLAPPGASDALLSTLETLRGKAAEAAKRHTNKKDTPRMGTDGGALLFAAERARSRFVAGVVDAARIAAEGGASAASAAVKACPSAAVGDALASVAGRAARDSLAVGAETPPIISAREWWSINHAEAVLDPFDEHVSPDGVPGGRARDPLPRLLGLEPEPKRAPPFATRVSLDDDGKLPGSTAGSRFTTPTKLATPDARARVEARVREAASAAKVSSPGVGSALKRRFAAASAPPTPLDAAATSIRKEAASLRVSLTNAARADAEATRATFEAARERLLRASRESASSAYSPRLDASGARGDAEDGAGDADDADFFETTAELDDDASEFVSAPSTPSAIAKAFDWKGDKGVTDAATSGEAPNEEKANAGAARDVEKSLAQKEKGALESTVGDLLATLSDDASASDPGEDADAHLDAFFAARAAEEDSEGEADGGEGVADAVVPEADEGRGRGSSPKTQEKKEPGDPEGLRAVEAATRAAREASAAAKAAAATRNENMTSEAREARDAAVAAAVVRAADASARALARTRRRAAQAARAVADAAALANLKTLRRAKQPAPRGSGGPDPAPATATSGRSGVSFAEDSARDPERAARIAKSSAMTGMPKRLLSRVTRLVTPFERVALDQATHLRLFSRDAQRALAAAARADSSDVEGTTAAKPGESWVMDANDALTAWAAASALEEASAASQARLTRALAEASEEQLRALENAARAARGAAPAADAAAATPKTAAGKRAFSSETSAKEKEKENEASSASSALAIVAEEGTDGDGSFASRSRKKPNANGALDEEKARAPPFSVDAALARFDPTRARASAPIRDDAFLVAAESAAAEAARLGPSARELYYASYKAAMEEATASLNRSDASAVLAAAAGAARSVRARMEDVSSSASRRVEPSPNPARRRADAALARRRASAAGARDDVGKRGTQLGPPFANERDGVSASSRDLYARGFGGADQTFVVARSPGKRSTDTHAGDTRSPHDQTASAPNTPSLGSSLPPDPFEPLLKWTQKEGGRALARLWDAELSALAAFGDGKRAETDSAMRRVDAASFASRLLLPLTAKGTKSLAYLDACLAVDAPGERDPLTLTAFVRALRDSARATSAASLGESRGGVEGRAGGGGGPLAGATARSHESAIARVAELVDAAVGTLKRRFQREGNAHAGVDPVTLTRFLADASVAPGDARAALAELRVWEGFPLDVRFARFRQAMRPRSVRLAERNAKRADSSGTAPGTDHEEPSLAFDPAIETELASAREDRIRLAAEGQRQTSVASAFAPGKALQRSPVKRDVFAKSPSKAITRNIAASPRTPTSARKNMSPGAPKTRGSGGRFGATVGSKSATRSASPFSAAGERAATRAAAELAAALEASPAGDDGSPLATAAVSRGTGGLSHRRRLDVSRSTEKLTAPRRPSSPATLRVVRAAAEAKESFHNINETLSQLEANAERFENDLLRSSATMAAMDAARREREDAATAALLRRARDARARAEAEDKAEMEARRVVAKRQSKK